MIKKLVSHGNSAALIIDKMETPFEISTDGKNLIISPVENAVREVKFKKMLGKVNKVHGKTLKKLSK